MPAITIPIPNTPAEQFIEIEVKINGVKQNFTYRVEMFRWDEYGDPYDERIDRLKTLITSYDANWQLFQIGTPTEEYIPIMFKQRLPVAVEDR